MTRRLRHPETVSSERKGWLEKARAERAEILPGFGYDVRLFRSDGSVRESYARTYGEAIALRAEAMAGDGRIEKVWIESRPFDRRGTK